MLIHKELHPGGNYTYIPILSKSLSWYKSAHDKIALQNHTVLQGLLYSYCSRASWYAASMLQYGHADGLWIVSILVGCGFFPDSLKPKHSLLLIFWIPIIKWLQDHILALGLNIVFETNLLLLFADIRLR